MSLIVRLLADWVKIAMITHVVLYFHEHPRTGLLPGMGNFVLPHFAAVGRMLDEINGAR